jgi:hypothetical protein
MRATLREMASRCSTRELAILFHVMTTPVAAPEDFRDALVHLVTTDPLGQLLGLPRKKIAEACRETIGPQALQDLIEQVDDQDDGRA